MKVTFVTVHRGKCKHPRASVVHTASKQLGPDGNIIPSGEPDNALKCLNCQTYFYSGEVGLDSEDDDMS